jgi:DNA-binding NarL/FixJ family response regulator
VLKLTSREIQILELVKLGYDDRQIGAELSIKTQTVKNHMQGIFHKLDAVNRVDAVVKALQSGYLSLWITK